MYPYCNSLIKNAMRVLDPSQVPNPDFADYSRSVSTIYYAMFHERAYVYPICESTM